MHKLFFCLLLSLVDFSYGMASANKEIDHSAEVIKKDQIDLKHLSLDLKIDWDQQQVKGNCRLFFHLLKDTNEFSLDAGMLKIHSIKLIDNTSLLFSYDGGDKEDGLHIKLNRNYSISEWIEINIDYHSTWQNLSDPNNIWGSFGKGLRFLGPSSTESSRRVQLWSVGEPASNKYWFPCSESLTDLRTTDISITVAKPLTAISNGDLKNILNNKDGSRTFRWSVKEPYANYLTSLVIGEYTDLVFTTNGVQVHSYCYPDELEAAKATTKRLKDMFIYYEKITGLAYPYSRYAQVFVQDYAGWLGSMYYSTITENMIDDEGTHNDYFYLWDLTEAEALAHQWFGSSIGVNSWQHVWLSKSMARYMSAMFNEQMNGSDEFLTFQLSYDQGIAISDYNNGMRSPIVAKKDEDIYSFVNSNQPYFHGAAVLHMLRQQIGEEQWLKVMKTYAKVFRGKLVTTNDFIQIVNKVTQRPMNWFFDQWVYKSGHPVFLIKKSYDETQHTLSLTIQQVQKADSLLASSPASYFQGKVEIEIDNRIESFWLEPKAENNFVIHSLKQPKLVHFDYKSAWIKELTFEKTVEENIFQFQHSKDILARLSAMRDLAKVYKDSSCQPEVKHQIENVFHQVVSSKIYWRLKFNLLSQFQSMQSVPPTDHGIKIDKRTSEILLNLIQNEETWVRAAAIKFLGMSRDPNYAEIYLQALKDKSDRVVNAAAIALGQSKSKKAYSALLNLKNKPSWKNQSLISALNGLKELGDTNATSFALNALTDAKSPHWTLATSTWDHRLAAAETLVSFGKTDKAYVAILEFFKRALHENNLNDIFYNTLQINTLADPRGKEVYDLLKSKFKNDSLIMSSIEQYEQQFNSSLKK